MSTKEMWSVLLVDDNPLLLEHFSKMADWSSFGFQKVFTAPDGVKAWKIFEKNLPELVFADIQMPRMTGIELAEKIKEKNPSTIVCFLTSYEEFSYVKSAIDLGVYHYLLKHELNREKLAQMLSKIAREITRNHVSSHYSAKAMLDSILEQSSSEKQSGQLPESYTLGLPDLYDFLIIEENQPYPPLMHIKNTCLPPSAAIQTHPQREHIVQAIYECTFDIVAATELSDDQYALLLKNASSVTESALRIKQELEKKFSHTFSVFILCEQKGILECARKYQQQREILNTSVFYAPSSIIHTQFVFRPRTLTFEPDYAQADRWLQDRDYDSFIAWMDQLFFQVTQLHDSRHFKQLVVYLAQKLIQCQEQIADSSHAASFSPFTEDVSRKWADANSVYQWLRMAFSQVRVLLPDDARKYSSLVTDAIRYVNSNYQNCTLGLEDIASHLKISTSRLNVLFKQETGETLWQLIIRVRMEHAAKQLSETSRKVSDICVQCGYGSVSYFSKVFREAYGCSPLEYRRKEKKL